LIDDVAGQEYVCSTDGRRRGHTISPVAITAIYTHSIHCYQSFDMRFQMGALATDAIGVRRSKVGKPHAARPQCSLSLLSSIDGQHETCAARHKQIFLRLRDAVAQIVPRSLGRNLCMEFRKMVAGHGGTVVVSKNTLGASTTQIHVASDIIIFRYQLCL
jgi:hypothetical protein